MHDISNLNHKELPSTKSLIKATAVALISAGILLVTVILPAEYGIDPTGLGAKLGLTKLNAASATETEGVTILPHANDLNENLSPVWKSSMKYRSDTMTLTLQPREGAEIKTKMKTGENFSFNWAIEGGAVSFDMHGDKFTSYWLGRNQSSASGSFVAPFDGTHGWYWKNNGKEPVTVHLTASGFYEAFYRP